MQNDLQGKIALVTGASRGIGQAIALELASRGAKVYGTATSEAGVKDINEKLASYSGVGKLLNVTDAEACDALIKELTDGDGLHILVNNAGITRDNLIMRMKDEEWDDIIQTNLTSVFRLCRAVVRPMMKAREGRIINITSVVGETGNIGQSNYAAAKAGVAGMSRALARELGSRNITVTCGAPGFIDTAMTQAIGDEAAAKLLSQIPLGKLGTVKDIAHAVAFLASPLAGYITGETLNVNGGMYMA